MNITEMTPVAMSATASPAARAAVETPDRPHPQAAEAGAERARNRQESEPGARATKAAQDELAAAVDQMNSMAQAFHRSVRFNLSHESGKVQVNVVDTDNDKVIREIPSKEMLNLVKRIHDFMGVILDEKR